MEAHLRHPNGGQDGSLLQPGRLVDEPLAVEFGTHSAFINSVSGCATRPTRQKDGMPQAPEAQCGGKANLLLQKLVTVVATSVTPPPFVDHGCSCRWSDWQDN